MKLNLKIREYGSEIGWRPAKNGRKRKMRGKKKDRKIETANNLK